MRRRALLIATLLASLGSYAVTPREVGAEVLAEPTTGLRMASLEVLHSPFAHQQATRWCWAATVAMAGWIMCWRADATLMC